VLRAGKLFKYDFLSFRRQCKKSVQRYFTYFFIYDWPSLRCFRNEIDSSLMDYFVLTSSRVINSVNGELKTEVSEIFSVSIICFDEVNGHISLAHIHTHTHTHQSVKLNRPDALSRSEEEGPSPNTWIVLEGTKILTCAPMGPKTKNNFSVENQHQFTVMLYCVSITLSMRRSLKLRFLAQHLYC
jgi:hypothetical protein